MLLAVCLLHTFLLLAFWTWDFILVLCLVLRDWLSTGLAYFQIESSFMRGIKSGTNKWRVPFVDEALDLVVPLAGRSSARFSLILSSWSQSLSEKE